MNVIYEQNLAAEPGIDGEVQAWLRDHIGAMLKQPGFRSATLYATEPDGVDPRHRYCIHYLLDSHQVLAHPPGHQAAASMQAAHEKFGERLSLSYRVLNESGSDTRGDPTSPLFCPNCDAPARGQYCAECGQRSQVRVITLWQLTRDLIGDLANLDSRIWLSLRTLLLKPGMLTQDYLKGRRARYMPPFRMYLVLSLVFFLINSDMIAVGNDVQVSPETQREAAQQVQRTREQVLEDLAKAGVPAERIDQVKTAFEKGGKERNQAALEAMTDLAEPDLQADLLRELTADSRKNGELCDNVNLNGAALPWMTTEETEAMARDLCVRATRDEGRELKRRLADNIPTMIFAFLPVVGLALKLMYPLSRRYYVEHLLFAVHVHSFVFLALLLYESLLALAHWAGLPSWPMTALASLYIPYYLYRSMRNVYGQGRFITLTKNVLLLFLYSISLLLTFLTTVVVTAATL